MDGQTRRSQLRGVSDAPHGIQTQVFSRPQCPQGKADLGWAPISGIANPSLSDGKAWAPISVIADLSPSDGKAWALISGIADRSPSDGKAWAGAAGQKEAGLST